MAVIVTGATSGMGRATALLLAREGAGVLANGRHAARGCAFVEEVHGTGGRAIMTGGR